MYTQLNIKNYKSIHDLSLELGRVNVFIGENGCGKSNILEAVAMLSCAVGDRLRNNDLAEKGIRVTRPNMMSNAFMDVDHEKMIQVTLDHQEGYRDEARLTATHFEDINSEWYHEGKLLVFRDENGPEYGIHESFFKGKDINKLLKILNKKITSNELYEYLKTLEVKDENLLINYLIYELQTNPLRGFNKQSLDIPGRNGENLDQLLETFDEEAWELLFKHSYFISWLEDEGIVLDTDKQLNRQRLKLRSESSLYLRDKYMADDNNLFSVENANEGALHILFYLALFISTKTPKFFAIDNIENALNPHLCRTLIKNIAELAKKRDKQSLITTHNPAVLDGLNLSDPDQRLFVVSRNRKGHTKVRRIEVKPEEEVGGQRLKLSELWMRNHLGGLPQNF